MRTFTALVFVVALGAAAAASEPAFGPHVMYGIIKHVGHVDLIVQRRSGQLETVDIAAAQASGRTGVLYVGRPVALYGDFDRSHHYHVNAINSAYGVSHGDWPSDR